MSSVPSHRGTISTLIYKYELQTALYMLEPWEKCLFNFIFLGIITLSALTIFQYTPMLVNKLTAY
ncbi:hypothetical protein K492DRAFT_141379 [Lichtheimia hyalospora FSU 10163]|uniref:Serine palmitoyltransferase small subunit A n=1 Tax=Lichtheimia ornata TaxID=688661 RepID=A0AAD7VBN1_9FUNG|nr:uncharacterized protein O0I10_001491 [Lichtheimia ornata]KAI7885794.1 hypothetical protein K492DRAFT_141379 [Lichtheimia hyalospora FSU 10163]KAJ8662530.1 hypothetical protein O0I10_001491 [Lichtheimia ornata]